MTNSRSPSLAKFLHLGLLALAAVLLSACASAHQWNGSPYQDPKPAPEVELTTTAGEDFRLADQRGKVVMLFFGYTSCPDICPATTADAARIFETLGQDSEQVEFVFVSVDSPRDDPKTIRAYLDKFHSDFTGLHGDAEQLDPILAAYGVYAAPDEPVAHDHDHEHDHEHEHDGEDGHDDGYTVTHTSRVFLIDPEGNLVTNYTFGTPREEILADIRYLLQQ